MPHVHYKRSAGTQAPEMKRHGALLMIMLSAMIESWNWPVKMERIYQYLTEILFYGRKRNVYLGEHSLEESLMSLDKHSNPKQRKHVEAVVQETGKLAKNSSITQKNRHFCVSFCASFCKFCLWKYIETTWKTRKTP